ncbi:uncharacterized protein LOC129743552 [Uranotaenia lowii]|uniref:uncharacterized protein LOC129743552 n=1 Tax=Uranotaenia lowii TaxID=190385 RepID=UPI00247A305F|nr:uncharacterized protein LOC129743552 [Uranotaenia lowii]
MAHRLFNIPMENSEFESEKERILLAANLNGYDEKFVYKILRKHERKRFRSNATTFKPEKEESQRVSLPFHPPLTNGIRKILSNHGLKVAYKSSNTLKDCLVSLKDKVPPEERSGIYEIPCEACPAVYIGQTRRKFKTRIKEHKNAVENNRSNESSVPCQLKDVFYVGGGVLLRNSYQWWVEKSSCSSEFVRGLIAGDSCVAWYPAEGYPFVEGHLGDRREPPPPNNPFHHLLNQQYTNDPTSLADSFCEHFASISSSSNTPLIPFPTDQAHYQKDYNSKFSYDELESFQAHNSAGFEKQQLLDNRQFAFRSGRSIDDYFEELESIIDPTTQKQHHTECLSLDLSKAFDRVDRIAIINQLNNWGIGGRMLRYIADFLQNRSVQVLVNGKRSHTRPIHGGVPQGSVIAPSLFLVAVNSIFQKVPSNTRTLVYADDILLITSSAFSKTTRKRLQNALNEVAN